MISDVGHLNMANFIHLTDEKNTKEITTNGIASTKIKGIISGIYCFPVLKDFYLTHQWSRELKRRGIRSFVCIQFKIKDDEIVFIGKYNGDHMKMTANQAICTIMEHDDPMGLEIIIRRRIKSTDITRLYPAPKITGWRYYPSAKGKKPFCHCKYCNRGEIRANRLIIDDAQQGDAPEPANNAITALQTSKPPAR